MTLHLLYKGHLVPRLLPLNEGYISLNKGHFQWYPRNIKKITSLYLQQPDTGYW